MQCILTALKAESQPLIDHFKLIRDSTYPFPVFRNGYVALIALGVGKKNIHHRITTFYNSVQENNIQFINIGISGGNPTSTKIGECYFLHEIKDEMSGALYYPDILVKHSLEEISLVTVENVVSNEESRYRGLVDMEASEIFNVCSSIVPLQRLAFIKIVSDHMDLKFEEIIALPISTLISNHLASIELFFIRFNHLLKEETPILSETDIEWIHDTIQELALTETQSLQLTHCLKGFRIRLEGLQLPEIEKISTLNKSTQKILFRKICEKLST